MGEPPHPLFVAVWLKKSAIHTSDSNPSHSDADALDCVLLSFICLRCPEAATFAVIIVVGDLACLWPCKMGLHRLATFRGCSAERMERARSAREF